MDDRYIFVFIAVNVFCLLISLLIVSKFSLNVGSERDVQIFRRMVICYIGFVVFDLVWVLSMSGVLPLSPLAYGVVKVFGTLFIPFMVYFWFTFAENRFKSTLLFSSRWNQALAAIPVFILVLLYITSFRTGLIFQITPEETVVPGPLYAASGIVDNLYGFAIIFHALYLIRKHKEKDNLSTYMVQIFFIVICTVGGILDAVVSNSPIMPLAICLSFVYLFISIQEPQIYNDALTGLNNRRRTDIYLRELLAGSRGNAPMHLFMLDVDDFKQINDIQGHLAGDRALQAVGKALQAVTDEYKGFVSRWAGDEFLMILPAERDGLLEEIRGKIAHSISLEAQGADISGPLEVSIGHTFHAAETAETPSELIQRADLALYQDKEARKKGRAHSAA